MTPTQKTWNDSLSLESAFIIIIDVSFQALCSSEIPVIVAIPVQGSEALPLERDVACHQIFTFVLRRLFQLASYMVLL